MSDISYCFLPLLNICEFIRFNLVNDNVRRCEEQGYCGDYGEERERDEAQPVEHHGGKLPVVLDGRRVLVVANLVRYDANLLEDQAELAIDSG